MTHQEKQKDNGRRLQVRAESQQTAIAILHHELLLVPGHVAKSPKSGGECGSVRKLEGWNVKERGKSRFLASLGMTMVGAATFRRWFCDAHAEDEQWHACAHPI